MMRLICSLKSVRSSLDMSEGLVVIPAGKPRLSASSISTRFAESTKIFIPPSPDFLPAGLSSERFPLHFVGGQCGMRHNQVPYDRLERLGMRRDRPGIDGGHDDASVGDLGGKSPIAADDSVDLRTDLARQAQRLDQVVANAAFGVTAAHRKDQHRIVTAKPAPHQPADVRLVPAVIVDARSQFGDVVGGGVAFDVGNLAEVVDGMRGVRRAAADPQDEKPSAIRAKLDESLDDSLDFGLR